MRLSKKAEYAIRAVVAMGRRGRTEPVAIQELSKSERIPVKFLEHILLELKKGDLLRSKRGVGGGYFLNRLAEDISLAAVIEVIDGQFVPLSCLEPGRPGYCGCGQRKPCGLAAVFGELQGDVMKFLKQRSVADVVAHEASAGPSFDI